MFVHISSHSLSFAPSQMSVVMISCTSWNVIVITCCQSIVNVPAKTYLKSFTIPCSFHSVIIILATSAICSGDDMAPEASMFSRRLSQSDSNLSMRWRSRSNPHTKEINDHGRNVGSAVWRLPTPLLCWFNLWTRDIA